MEHYKYICTTTTLTRKHRMLLNQDKNCLEKLWTSFPMNPRQTSRCTNMPKTQKLLKWLFSEPHKLFKKSLNCCSLYSSIFFPNPHFSITSRDIYEPKLFFTTADKRLSIFPTNNKVSKCAFIILQYTLERGPRRRHPHSTRNSSSQPRDFQCLALLPSMVSWLSLVCLSWVSLQAMPGKEIEIFQLTIRRKLVLLMR